jgi:hypothetical protein
MDTIEKARYVAREYLERISVYDVQSLLDCSTTEAEQIVHMVQIAEVRI